MDKITKFLKQLSNKERLAFLFLIEQIKNDPKKAPGLRKLAGYKGLYRARIGKYRLIFKISKNSSELIRISKRDERTYKNLT